MSKRPWPVVPADRRLRDLAQGDTLAAMSIAVAGVGVVTHRVRW